MPQVWPGLFSSAQDSPRKPSQQSRQFEHQEHGPATGTPRALRVDTNPDGDRDGRNCDRREYGEFEHTNILMPVSV